MSDTFYITTAIDYVNGAPHLGHAYEKVLTDVIARYQRQKGRNVFFLTGVDEHGQKVQKSAAQQGRSPQEFCDEMSDHFRRLCEKLNISIDDFVRTTEPRHQKVVQQILSRLYEAGEIYKGEYEGYYSARAEQFLAEKDMVDGKFPEKYGEVVRLKEPVYFFRLAKHQDWLRDYLQKNPNFIFPSFRTKEVLGALENPINDLCISRPKNRLNWGIPLPFDAEQVTYVWFDALINYVSVIGYGTDKFKEYWPAVHVIGKDILVPAHAIYWPIILRALGMEMPRQIIVHGWWMQNKEKMSKSTGNVVDPLKLIEVYGVDAFRYFVLREMAVGQDADFSQEQFHRRYQSDLANDLGNLVHRVISMIHRYRGSIVPEAKPSARLPLDDDLEAKVQQAITDFRKHMDSLHIHLALQELWRGFQRANQYVEENAPWKLAKDPTQAERLDGVLNRLITAVILLTRELKPLFPQTVENIFKQAGFFGDEDKAMLEKKFLDEKHALGQSEVLFPRIDSENIGSST
ncbi:MAG: methionine--tRNA ligase [bacterium]